MNDKHGNNGQKGSSGTGADTPVPYSSRRMAICSEQGIDPVAYLRRVFGDKADCVLQLMLWKADQADWSGEVFWDFPIGACDTAFIDVDVAKHGETTVILIEHCQRLCH